MPNGLRKSVVFLVLAIPTVGCINPARTQLPSFAASHPVHEKRSLERFDPFPDQNAGPETSARPRGFIEQRSDVRRTRENTMLRGFNREQVAPTTAIPSSQIEYSNSVRE